MPEKYGTISSDVSAKHVIKEKKNDNNPHWFKYSVLEPIVLFSYMQVNNCINIGRKGCTLTLCNS
jgi:hypothetical protein